MTVENAAELGFDPTRLSRLSDTLKSQIDSGYIHGAAMRVSRRGKIVVDFLDGYAEQATGRRLDSDSVFVTLSACKPFTAILVLGLVERGLLRLHNPVADIIPEFGKVGKETITLFHLLTHTAGMMSGAPSLSPEILGNIEKLVEALGNMPAECLPGERVSYSMLVAHSIMAAMCLRVDGRGRRYSQMLNDEIFEPLGMKDTSLGMRDDLAPRLCPVRGAAGTPAEAVDPFIQLVEHVMLAPGAEMPAGGAITSIGDLHRFAEMLRRGGEIDGVRLISPAMIRLAARNWIGDKPNLVWDPALSTRGWSRFPDNIGLGFRVRGTGIGPGPFGVLNSPGTFGHMGGGSTGFWIDPEHDLSYALLTTGLLEETHSLERSAMLSDLVMAALVD
ncbi:CubicO group peptidase (beta-lactamase class C family) [Sphingopyxis panaciterrae]|uniref:serine hydrolase domain-containing protein n=1 Tax=Sphingopyxis panaciterrae TaxID=363841 RepID=UPI001420C3A1|nr:serine hydrolase domain-containing protein [Sphingopyxis panaciterrae]NIJ37634.1 CubicO group peptidase (beta-lactamase class C family) [Sphingopyxis panaciterrae]